MGNLSDVVSCWAGATNVVVDLSKPPPPMPPPRPRVGIDVKSFYDDPTDPDWCRDGVCFVELGAASGHPDFMRRLRGVDGPHGYNPTVQESGTFLFMYAWAICVTSMTSCFVHRDFHGNLRVYSAGCLSRRFPPRTSRLPGCAARAMRRPMRRHRARRYARFWPRRG